MKGKCKKCGIKLPVPTWNYCLLHDSSTKKVVNEKLISLKDPILSKQQITRREYKKNIIPLKPFKNYMGFKIKIPFEKFLYANYLIVDFDK